MSQDQQRDNIDNSDAAEAESCADACRPMPRPEEEVLTTAAEAPSCAPTGPPPPPLGSLVRFRATNGKWYFGTVTDLVPPIFGGPPLAHLEFSHPTAAWMKLPLVLPIPCVALVASGALPAPRTQLAAGTRLWARPQPAGLWEPAELEAADREGGGRFAVVLHASGRRCVLARDAVAEHVHAPRGIGEEVESSSSSEDGSDDDSDYGGRRASGGAAAAADLYGDVDGQNSAKGPDTMLFAGWEAHTRGVASRMLLKMGFKGAGAGLGRDGGGRAVPVQVGTHLAGTKGLGCGGDDERKMGDAAPQRKRKRGAARKQAAQVAREAAKAEEAAQDPGVFGFLNRTLAGSRQSLSSLAPAASAGGPEGDSKKRKQPSTDDRVHLMRQQDGIQALKAKQKKYEDMLARNKNDKTVSAAVTARLAEIRRDLASAERARDGAATALATKTAQKKFKF